MNKNFFKNKSLLLTGGTGSFGSAFVNYLLKNKAPLKKLIIFSRDELKQFEMSKIYNENKYSCMRYFIGDVRDKERLKMAFRDVDIVVHAAALKQVPTAEYNPIEYIKTNIIGAQNIIEASLDTNIQKVIALSTDKASSPINLYGATKLCSDKLFVSANNIKGSKNLMFSVIRYGNVMGSRGSVLHNFIEQKSNKLFEITDVKMTRFNITIKEAINFVIERLSSMKGGEIFVPKIPSFRIIDLAKAVSEKCKIRITGIRPGEKLHEEMISTFDSVNTVDLGNYYAILSSRVPNKYYKNFLKKEFSYRSDTNSHFLKIEDLKKIIKNLIS
jgi:UDP-N-acetylglucosamine 4,6-dehydratase (inverting)